MKAAVSHLEPHMEKKEGSLRGKVVLATVKGDVHDIGKNLVDIILTNNGFEVVNLGIKVPSEQLIQAVREHKPERAGPIGAAGQERAADGGDRGRLEGGGNRRRPAGRRRRAVAPVHAPQDRGRLRRPVHLRQGRHDRLEAGREAHQQGCAAPARARGRAAHRRGQCQRRRLRGGVAAAGARRLGGAPRSRAAAAARSAAPCRGPRPRSDLVAGQPADALRQAPRAARLGPEAQGRRRRALPQARAHPRRGQGGGSLDLRGARGLAVLSRPVRTTTA